MFANEFDPQLLFCRQHELILSREELLAARQHGVAHQRRILRRAENDADRRVVVGTAFEVVEHSHVHVHLADVAVSEFLRLDVEDDEALQDEVVKHEVDAEVLCIGADAHLPFDEREALTEFQQERLQVVDQSLLKVRLHQPSRLGQTEELQQHRIAHKVAWRLFKLDDVSPDTPASADLHHIDRSHDLPSALGDEVADSISQAGRDYRRGRLDAAAARLERAARLIREARSSALVVFLPAPLSGWFASPSEAEAVTDPLLPGGASSAAREYLQGERLVRIRILADAPAVQSALQVLGSPAFSSIDGAKPVKVHGQPGMLKFDVQRRSGRMTLVVAQRYLVSIDGVDVTVETLAAFAEATDVAGLARMN